MALWIFATCRYVDFTCRIAFLNFFNFISFFQVADAVQILRLRRRLSLREKNCSIAGRGQRLEPHIGIYCIRGFSGRRHRNAYTKCMVA